MNFRKENFVEALENENFVEALWKLLKKAQKKVL